MRDKELFMWATSTSESRTGSWRTTLSSSAKSIKSGWERMTLVDPRDSHMSLLKTEETPSMLSTRLQEPCLREEF